MCQTDEYRLQDLVNRLASLTADLAAMTAELGGLAGAERELFRNEVKPLVVELCALVTEVNAIL